MKRGYRVTWTDHALSELRETFDYLESNFSEREIEYVAKKIESVIGYISKFPELYPETTK